MSFLQIKIKYLIDELDAVAFKDGSDWLDLRASEDILLEKGNQYLIPLGVCIELPSGHEAYIAPRGSSFKNWGVLQTNSIGIIDEAFCGDNDQWFWPVYATRDAEIKMNDRVCQFRIMKKQPKFSIIEVDELKNRNRGSHGSTGVN